MKILLRVNSKTPLWMFSILTLFAANQVVCQVDSQKNPHHSIRMVSAEVPLYPEDAETAGIEGTIIVEVQVRNGEVFEAIANNGPLLLRRSALANVHTWHFSTNLTMKFHSKFTYRLMAASGCDMDRQRLTTLNLPYTVEITSSYIETCDPVVDIKPTGDAVPHH